MVSFEEALEIVTEQVANESKEELLREICDIRVKIASLEAENRYINAETRFLNEIIRLNMLLDKLVDDGLITREYIDNFEFSLESN